MRYTKTAKIIAGITLTLGVLNLLVGLLAAFGVPTPEAARLVESGKAIDQGLYFIFSAVLLGVLTDISLSLSNNKTPRE